MAAAKKTRLKVLRTLDVTPEGRTRDVMFALFRVFGRWTEVATRQVKQHGLTLPHFDVLMSLKAGEGISQQDLSERLMLTKGNICIMVQKMEVAGLIERRSDPADQRYHRLYLTDAGRRLIAKMMPGHRALANQIFGSLNSEEQKTLHELLCRVDDAFDEIVE